MVNIENHDESFYQLNVFRSLFSFFAAATDEEDGNSNNGGMLGGISMKMSDHIKNNPFAKMVDRSSFGISSKSILRQSRLQFATPSIGLMSSTSTSMAAGAAAVAAAAAAVTPSKDNLFACSLTNVSPINRNAIQRKYISTFRFPTDHIH